MKNTYLTLAAVLALATAATLTPVAISQQAFAQDGGAESETEIENQAKNKCVISGLGNSCDQTADADLTITVPTAPPAPGT
ncbi:MAG: hypothetical protein M3297_08195 [Thermoproteota archaeon]|jgi:hypothetical protein|nr:hypothetical protein [Thermoproteota archaeon]